LKPVILLPILAAAVIAAAQSVAPVTLDELLARAGAYVAEFEHRFSNVVAEEYYVQRAPLKRINSTAMPGLMHRELRSDFLFVKVQGDEVWMPFRDVFEVDGKPVRDRQERLTALFLQPQSIAVDQAKKIADESARYNIGDVLRTINLPVLALEVLRPENQRRFAFSRLRIDRRAGPDVWSIEFREIVTPTMVRGEAGKDLLSEGRFRIEASTGRVVRTELVVDEVRVRASITTHYRPDAAFGFSLPVEMQEEYSFPRSSVTIVGTATYSKFRRFSVQTDETMRSAVPELMEIPAGRFTMGSPSSEAGRNADEVPHEVTISRPFFLGRFEVSQQEWLAVMGTRPSRFADCGLMCPVENVSFLDVRQFLETLNASASNEFVYRLPTEAEWEYACRAGTTTPFATGVNLTTDQANYNGKFPYASFAPGIFRERPTIAGSFGANTWGLADMHGNVWEWTADWYGPYPSGAARDPRGAAAGEKRVIRGGSWFFDANSARCALRYTHAPADRGFSLGFRVAADRRSPAR
jgi:formylglycine-generating enzyme required for sulfatase activity